ncbi:hypothetical protein [Tepidiforma sp.]|uniref:hypothetical protein n=1 Tax=Tepidiforma sp. TaxID=2682230 RepID=UPI002ADE56C1|nr:hypothetical protein [Tepidiforma sp.]
MSAATSACVLLTRSETGWLVCPVDSANRAAAWLPLGIEPSRPAAEAIERARALFPGRLVAIYTP